LDITRPAPAVLLKGLTLHKPVALAKLSVLVFGKSGVGKTALAGTAEDDDRSAPVLVIDTEGGTQTLIMRGTRLDVLTLESDARDTLRNLFGQFDRMLDKGESLPYQTIVLDSITMLGRHIMRGITRSETPEIKDWQHYDSQLRAILAYLLSPEFPCHVIVTAHEKEDDETHVITPGMQGGVHDALPHFFNTVGRMYTTLAADPRDPKARIARRRLLLANTSNVEAKDRMDPTGTLPRELESPTVTMLLDRLTAGSKTS
jgi:hypothetical protein